MKIGIVGGTGNISQPIVKLLLEKGHEVVVFNRGQTTKAPNGVRVIQGDRWNREDFEQKMQAEKFDAAIDMICFTAEDASAVTSSIITSAPSAKTTIQASSGSRPDIA